MEETYYRGSERKIKSCKRFVGVKRENAVWLLIITVLSLFVSVALSMASAKILEGASVFISFSVVLVIILVGVVFDIIGIAVAAADEIPFHAMASRKIYGSKQAITLIKNAEKVSSFSNDVIGDVCGVISGMASMYIIVSLVGTTNSEGSIVGYVVTGIVAALTVGGKAMGKDIAIKNSNLIVHKVGMTIKFLTRGFGGS